MQPSSPPVVASPILPGIFRTRSGFAGTIALFLLLSMPRIVDASWSTFSADGKSIYTGGGGRTIDVIDIGSGKTSTKHLELPEGSPDIEALSVARDGRIWVLTKDRLWLWNPKTEGSTLADTAPAGIRFEDVACHFASGRVVIAAVAEKPEPDEHTGRLFFKRNADDPATNVFVRRVDRVKCPVFLADGTLLFDCEGDLWHGVVLYDSEDDNRATLNAYRYAPLATRETYGGTPMQTGVSELAVSNTKIYVHIGRMGGSGWGYFIRLDRPKRLPKGKELDLLEGLDERLRINQAALGSVEIFSRDQRFFLCSSPDERRVHFAGYAPPSNDGQVNRPHFLITDDGAIRPLKTDRPVEKPPFPEPVMPKK